jgi:hypothetical protein
MIALQETSLCKKHRRFLPNYSWVALFCWHRRIPAFHFLNNFLEEGVEWLLSWSISRARQNSNTETQLSSCIVILLQSLVSLFQRSHFFWRRADLENVLAGLHRPTFTTDKQAFSHSDLAYFILMIEYVDTRLRNQPALSLFQDSDDLPSKVASR